MTWCIAVEVNTATRILSGSTSPRSYFYSSLFIEFSPLSKSDINIVIQRNPLSQLLISCRFRSIEETVSCRNCFLALKQLADAFIRKSWKESSSGVNYSVQRSGGPRRTLEVTRFSVLGSRSSRMVSNSESHTTPGKRAKLTAMSIIGHNRGNLWKIDSRKSAHIGHPVSSNSSIAQVLDIRFN